MDRSGGGAVVEMKIEDERKRRRSGRTGHEKNVNRRKEVRIVTSHRVERLSGWKEEGRKEGRRAHDK